MGGEARPQLGNHQRRVGAGQPPIERGDDVRIGMRSDQVGQVLRREVVRKRQIQLVESDRPTRVDHGAHAVVNNQKLIGLYGLTVLIDEVGEHQALVA